MKAWTLSVLCGLVCVMGLGAVGCGEESQPSAQREDSLRETSEDPHEDTAQCPPAPCEEGQERCASEDEYLEACLPDENGCLQWQDNLRCGYKAGLQCEYIDGVPGCPNECVNANPNFAGRMVITSQEQLDSSLNIYCTEQIDGDLIIHETEVTSLEQMKFLKKIHGNLIIIGNTALNDLTGLRRLEYIGGELIIEDNKALTTLDGFDALVQVGNGHSEGGLFRDEGLETGTDGIYIRNNPALISLSGLPLLDELGGRLEINNNLALRLIDGLNALTSIQRELTITLNPNLQELDGFGSLNSVGSTIDITKNNTLEDITGFGSLGAFQSTLKIEFNDELLSITGFGALQDASDATIEIERNPKLADISGFASLQSVRILKLEDSQVEDLHALEQLRHIKALLTFSQNPALVNVDGLYGLVEIGQSLQITNHDELCDTDINALLAHLLNTIGPFRTQLGGNKTCF